jgi:hypothetical protein
MTVAGLGSSAVALMPAPSIFISSCSQRELARRRPARGIGGRMTWLLWLVRPRRRAVDPERRARRRANAI